MTLARKIRLTLPIPPSGNHYKKPSPHGGMYLTREAKDFHSNVAHLAHGIEPIEKGLLTIQLLIFRGEKEQANGQVKLQRGDLDNYEKVLLDSLQGKVYRNDSQIRRKLTELVEDRVNPRVEVTVEPYTPTGALQAFQTPEQLVTPAQAMEFHWPGLKDKLKSASYRRRKADIAGTTQNEPE